MREDEGSYRKWREGDCGASQVSSQTVKPDPDNKLGAG